MSNLQPDTLIKNPQGCHVVSSVEVPADAAQVWAVVGDFAGFDRFIPALSHTEMTGEGVSSLRKKIFKDGNVVVEQLNDLDDDLQHVGGGESVGGDASGIAERREVASDLDDHCRTGCGWGWSIAGVQGFRAGVCR